MIKLYDSGVYLVNGTEIIPAAEAARVQQITGKEVCPEEASKGTIAYSVMKAHNTADSMDHLKIRFDAMASHDITFVGIIRIRMMAVIEFNNVESAAVYIEVYISLLEIRCYGLPYLYFRM